MTDSRLVMVRELRATLANLEAALAAIDNAIVWIDEDGQILWCNAAFDHLLELPHIDILGGSIVSLLPLSTLDSGLPVSPHPVSLTLAGARSVTGSYLFCQNHRERYLDVSVSPLAPDGTAPNAVLVVRDVTLQQLQHADLLKHEKMLQTVVSNLPVSILALDPNGVLTLAVGQGLEIMGISGARAIGTRIFDYFQDAPRIKRLFQDALGGGRSHTLLEIGHSCFEIWFAPIREDSQALIGLIAVVSDVTNHRQLARQQRELEALKQADELKTQFLSVLSHELRTPLSVLRGYSDILDEEIAGPLTAQQHQYLTRIKSGIALLTRHVDDLLNVSQILADKSRLLLQAVDLSQTIHDTVTGLEPMAAAKRQSLSLKLPPSLPRTLADAQRISQVLANLLENAIKFTPEGGRIEVTVGTEGEHLRCEVTDTGPGIPREKIALLFQYFTQLDMSPTRKTGGLGLGLTISKHYIEAHGGQIGVTSRLGQGSTFWFRLPIRPVDQS